MSGGFTGRTKYERENLGKLQTSAHYELNSHLKESGHEPQPYFHTAITHAQKVGVISSEEAKGYTDTNKAGNLAKHEYGPAYFEKMPKGTVQYHSYCIELTTCLGHGDDTSKK
jgi:hypothetical protein